MQLNRKHTFFSWSVQSPVRPIPFDRAEGLSTLLLRNLLTVSPPLCITETELRDGLQIIEEALDIADQRLA